MLRDNESVQRMDSIQDILVSQIDGGSANVPAKRLNRFMLRLRSVGFAEGRTLDGARRRYLLIEGKSLEAACHILKPPHMPWLVAWEEASLLDFLKSQLDAGRNTPTGTAGEEPMTTSPM